MAKYQTMAGDVIEADEVLVFNKFADPCLNVLRVGECVSEFYFSPDQRADAVVSGNTVTSIDRSTRSLVDGRIVPCDQQGHQSGAYVRDIGSKDFQWAIRILAD